MRTSDDMRLTSCSTCPHCFGHMHVETSRPVLYGPRAYRKRYRVCRSCAHRITTVEVSLKHFESLLSLAEQLQTLQRTLQSTPLGQDR